MSDSMRTETVRNPRIGHTEALYSICQVADLLGVPPLEVVQWLEKGWLPCRRRADEPIRISQSQLVVFLRNRGIDLEAIMAKAVLNEARQAAKASAPVAIELPPATAAKGPPAPSVYERPAARPPSPAREERSQLPAPPAPPQLPPPPAPPAEKVFEDIDFDLSSMPDEELFAPAAAAKTSVEVAGTIEPFAAGADVAEKVLRDAAARRATAVHLEIADRSLSVRLRIDGAMCDSALCPPATAGAELAAEFKKLAGIPSAAAAGQSELSGLSELSKGFSLTCSGREIEFSLFACPTTRGEKIVIRLSDPRGAAKADEAAWAGLREGDERSILALLAQPAGIVVVAGLPRGGRCEMLRAMALRVLNAAPRGAVSAAAVDSSSPADWRELPGVTHVKLDPAAGPDCAQALRAFQACAALDADLILAPRLQDPATLAAAARAAEEGRLILAGMGAPSAGAALERLREMGLDDWKLASVLLGVVARGTVRRLCPRCKRAEEPAEAALHDLGFRRDELDFPIFSAQGCRQCAETGYVGTIPLVSVLKADRQIAAMIRRGEGAEAIEKAARSSGGRTLREAAMEPLRAGFTSLHEVARACPPEL
jgi:type IV pilus assembly protein PilB